MTIELIYFEGCPHADQARERLRQACDIAGSPLEWTEWNTTDTHTPARYHRFGSPTVLLDGVDLARGAEGEGPGCVADGGPTVEEIVEALLGGNA
jgi:hypothetical protein